MAPDQWTLTISLLYFENFLWWPPLSSRNILFISPWISFDSLVRVLHYCIVLSTSWHWYTPSWQRERMLYYAGLMRFLLSWDIILQLHFITCSFPHPTPPTPTTEKDPGCFSVLCDILKIYLNNCNLLWMDVTSVSLAASSWLGEMV